MLVVSECIAKAALEREESRGGHTRDDFPKPDPEWGAKNLVLTLPGDALESAVELKHQPLPVMPDELKTLFEEVTADKGSRQESGAS
jgi:succinate dehydrogenase / fumarate reductase flavoprotein subunit